MASHQTTNFQLCQWEAEDEVLRTDFNSDNLKIENALSAIKTVADVAYTTEKAPVVFGWYAGEGTAKRKIELGFTPKAVLVMESNGTMAVSSGSFRTYYGGLAVTDSNACAGDNGRTVWKTGSTIVAVTEGGFYVSYSPNDYGGIYSDLSGRYFHYLAFR